MGVIQESDTSILYTIHTLITMEFTSSANYFENNIGKRFCGKFGSERRLN